MFQKIIKRTICSMQLQARMENTSEEIWSVHYDMPFFNLTHCGLLVSHGTYLLLFLIISFHSQNQVSNKSLELKVLLLLNLKLIFNESDFFILKEKKTNNKITPCKLKPVCVWWIGKLKSNQSIETIKNNFNHKRI